MRILVVSNIEWADDNAFGNTVSNWFSNLPDIEFASIYRRHSRPNNSTCKKYYSITLLSIIKNYFSPQYIGKEFKLENNINIKNEKLNNTISLEKKIIHCFHRCLGISVLPLIERYYFFFRNSIVCKSSNNKCSKRNSAKM